MTLARVLISIQGKYSCLKTQGSEVSLKNLARVKVYFLSKLFINSDRNFLFDAISSSLLNRSVQKADCRLLQTIVFTTQMRT